MKYFLLHLFVYFICERVCERGGERGRERERGREKKTEGGRESTRTCRGLKIISGSEQVKVFAAQPNGLSSILRTHIVEGKNWLLRMFSDLHKRSLAYIHTVSSLGMVFLATVWLSGHFCLLATIMFCNPLGHQVPCKYLICWAHFLPLLHRERDADAGSCPMKRLRRWGESSFSLYRQWNQAAMSVYQMLWHIQVGTRSVQVQGWEAHHRHLCFQEPWMHSASLENTPSIFICLSRKS